MKKQKFNEALRQFLISHTFYSLGEYLCSTQVNNNNNDKC